MITFIKLPILFNITPQEDLEKAEKLSMEVEQILESDFIYINIDNITTVNKSSGGDKVILGLKGYEQSMRVDMLLGEFLDILKGHNVEILNDC